MYTWRAVPVDTQEGEAHAAVAAGKTDAAGAAGAEDAAGAADAEDAEGAAGTADAQDAAKLADDTETQNRTDEVTTLQLANGTELLPAAPLGGQARNRCKFTCTCVAWLGI